MIPLVHVRRQGGPRGNVLLRLGLEGKIRPDDWPEVEEPLTEGHEVLSFDPRGLGETRMRYKAASIETPRWRRRPGGRLREPLFRHPRQPRVQRSARRPAYLFEMIEDVEIATGFARARLGAHEHRRAGDARLLARVVAAACPTWRS